jgi:hypothetical protein
MQVLPAITYPYMAGFYSAPNRSWRAPTVTVANVPLMVVVKRKQEIAKEFIIKVIINLPTPLTLVSTTDYIIEIAGDIQPSDTRYIKNKNVIDT